MRRACSTRTGSAARALIAELATIERVTALVGRSVVKMLTEATPEEVAAAAERIGIEVWLDHVRRCPDPRARLRDRIGEVHGHLTVIAQAPSGPHGSRWLCRCRCGGEVVVAGGSLTCGYYHTCGCGPHGPAVGGGPRYRGPATDPIGDDSGG